VAVALERPAQGDKPASAGWYNLIAARRFAAAQGRQIEIVNGDAYSNELKAQTIATLKQLGMKLDTVVYSLASPKRTDPATGKTFSSVLKPIGQAYSSKSINLNNDQLITVDIAPASQDDIDSTVKVMGGEDWALWIRALQAEGLLAQGFRTVAYSYLGPALTYPIYRSGTIGKAKEDLERTATALNADLASVGGSAVVAVAKALVTQASAAIPVVPLYISILFKVMKAKGLHEGTIEQITRMFRDHLAPGVLPKLDEAGRIRIDDRELDPGVQVEVDRIWGQVTTETLFTDTDYAGFKRDFLQLFGFEVPGVDYTQPVDVQVE
jgi:enoyl-[acyl-carrier protein] reductase/trans-2-enoyl-CoA reductase (NAD+)